MQTVVNTQVAESMVPAFRNPPECMLERQGSFEISFLAGRHPGRPRQRGRGVPVPAGRAGRREAPPILGGADLAALFNGNDDEAIEVMEFLTSDEFGAEWAQAGGWLSPHRTFDASNYPNQTTKDIAEQATDASAGRLRRLRRDAQGGRLRHVLDRHGRVDPGQELGGHHG